MSNDQQPSPRITIELEAGDCEGATTSDTQSLTIGARWSIMGAHFTVQRIRHLANGGLQLVMRQSD
jgi:hypothetical protein